MPFYPRVLVYQEVALQTFGRYCYATYRFTNGRLIGINDALDIFHGYVLPV